MPVNYGSLPFLEALAFFRAKLNLPTQRWDDLLGAAHDRAFVVAGATKADLLADLRRAVDQAIADGTTIETFRKDFKRIVAERGWTGWTGEGAKAGEAWRTRVLYETNLFSSYSAGRYQQMKAVADLRPYWRYRHSPASTVPRAEHLAWDGLILRHDDPWFASHTPPNGFGCKCYLETLAERDLKKQGLAVTPKAQIPYAGTDPKTGLPQGVDKGWDYQPGAGVDTALRTLVSNKLITYPPAIAKALSADVNRQINAQSSPEDYVRRVLADRSTADPLWMGFVENFDAIQQQTGLDLKGYLVLLTDQSPRHVEKHHQWDGKGQRQARPEDYAHVPQLLSDYDSIALGKTSGAGRDRLVVTKRIGQEVFRAVFDVLPGKRNRSVALVTLTIKG
ncbi:MAG: head morphogenesis protein [Candidatus Competibacter sp.]|nr:head morphogenesis protein [Candidatus Competibacter sp.]MDG4606465.1 phage minor head protein [Candidatus Contendobacter sp.]MDS4059283.1 phage minor head protein [Candidatus Contendobacter sp.]